MIRIMTIRHVLKAEGSVRPSRTMLRARERSTALHVVSADVLLHSFNIKARSGRARVAEMVLPHYDVSTPVFMPVGTQATLKGLTTQQFLDVCYEVHVLPVLLCCCVIALLFP